MRKLPALPAVVMCASALLLHACESSVITDGSGGQGGAGAAGASGGAGAAGANGGAGAASCATPLDEEDLPYLAIVFFPGIIELQPGQSHAFEVGLLECCYFFEPIEACAEWSVAPSEGATITEDGVLTIDPTVDNGAMFLVQADIEQGRALLEAEVWVYTEQDNPLVGSYHEISQFDCQQGDEFVPDELIGELRFLANSQFMLTWFPFEVYVDYWGPYAYELPTGALTITAEDGNYIPTDLDGQGTFSFDANGDLLLADMYLGSPYAGAPGPPACGHRFQ